MEQKPTTTIEHNVLEAIEKGELQMTPRWHFVLRAAVITLSGIILLLAVIYLASFIMFMLYRSGNWTVPSFGVHGWYAFIRSLPWLLILLVIIFAVLIEILARRAGFAYRRTALYSTLGILGVIMAASAVVAATPLHRLLFTYAEHGQLPLGGGLYRRFDDPPDQTIHHGVIIQLIPKGFSMRTRRAETFQIIITPRTRLPFGADFETGDAVIVLGPQNGNSIEAFGVREVKE